MIEIGAYEGASALWLHDRLQMLQAAAVTQKPFKVVSVDLGPKDQHHRVLEMSGEDGAIEFIYGDAASQEVIGSISEIRRHYETCLVIEDSAHSYENTLAVMDGYGPMVSVNSFLVVEDAWVDLDYLEETHQLRNTTSGNLSGHEGEPVPANGVSYAIRDWLSNHPNFAADRSLEPLMTKNQNGYIRRLSK